MKKREKVVERKSTEVAENEERGQKGRKRKKEQNENKKKRKRVVRERERRLKKEKQVEGQRKLLPWPTVPPLPHSTTLAYITT